MATVGRGADQYTVRFPDGLRDRIKAAADASGRSMNAEIIATLEEKYPERNPFRDALQMMRKLSDAAVDAASKGDNEEADRATATVFLLGSAMADGAEKAKKSLEPEQQELAEAVAGFRGRVKQVAIDKVLDGWGMQNNPNHSSQNK